MLTLYLISLPLLTLYSALLATMAAAILAVTATVNGATLPVEVVAEARNATNIASNLQVKI